MSDLLKELEGRLAEAEKDADRLSGERDAAWKRAHEIRCAIKGVQVGMSRGSAFIIPEDADYATAQEILEQSLARLKRDEEGQRVIVEDHDEDERTARLLLAECRVAIREVERLLAGDLYAENPPEPEAWVNVTPKPSEIIPEKIPAPRKPPIAPAARPLSETVDALLEALPAIFEEFPDGVPAKKVQAILGENYDRTLEAIRRVSDVAAARWVMTDDKKTKLMHPPEGWTIEDLEIPAPEAVEPDPIIEQAASAPPVAPEEALDAVAYLGRKGVSLARNPNGRYQMDGEAVDISTVCSMVNKYRRRAELEPLTAEQIR